MAHAHIQRLEAYVAGFAERCRQHERVVAAFVGGSLATGSADGYSDLDLYLITNSEGYGAFFDKREEFFRAWATPVFLEDFNEFGFDMLIVILEDGVQGELALAPAEDFSEIHVGAYRVLVDKGRVLEGVDFPAFQPSPEAQTETLRKQLNWFWREMALFYVAVQRDQRWTAYEYLENARQRFVALLRLEADFSAWAGSYEKLEKVIVAERLAEMEGMFSALDRNEMRTAADQLIENYKALAAGLAGRHKLEVPSTAQRVVEGMRQELKE